jgi:hypothetical protein
MPLAANGPSVAERLFWFVREARGWLGAQNWSVLGEVCCQGGSLPSISVIPYQYSLQSHLSAQIICDVPYGIFWAYANSPEICGFIKWQEHNIILLSCNVQVGSRFRGPGSGNGAFAFGASLHFKWGCTWDNNASSHVLGTIYWELGTEYRSICTTKLTRRTRNGEIFWLYNWDRDAGVIKLSFHRSRIT